MSEAGPLDRLLDLQHIGIKFGLENIRALCAALGHPEQRFESIIVGGTNGKGSVTAMVERGLRAAGHRTARYTSPHLVRLEERFVIDGTPVRSERLVDAADRVLAATDALIRSGTLATQATFFEATTAIAFVLFAEAGVRYAVLEVGMGGRFDATNVVTPVACAITTIDLDHQQFLGSTIASIAFEKAGIVKPGVPIVVGERKREAADVIRRACDEHHALFIDAWEGVSVAKVDSLVQIHTPAGTYDPVRLALAGDHQIANAVVAVRTLEQLAHRAGYVNADIVIRALRDVHWPGRLQWITYPDGRRLLLDAAHNPAGADALGRFLGQTLAAPVPIVLAVLRDKDARGIVAALGPHASAFILTRPATERASDPAELAVAVRRAAPEVRIEIVPAPLDARDAAFTIAPTVCACGSIFLIGELLAAERAA